MINRRKFATASEGLLYCGHMAKRLALIGIVGICLLGAAGATALAAAPKSEKQYAELKLKTSFSAWVKKHLPGATVKTVSCVLPVNGIVVKCVVHVASAPRYRENIVFKISETLHETGTMTWVATSHSCTDSKTGKSFSCGGVQRQSSWRRSLSPSRPRP
jgi:hypothetical protein